MVKAHFITPVGEFITVFQNKTAAIQAVGCEYTFTGINGEILIIPLPLQQNSVIIIN